MEVENSGFDGIVEASNGETLKVQGFITSDGLIILNGVKGSIHHVPAEGSVDQDTLDGQGVCRLGDEVGRFVATPRASR